MEKNKRKKSPKLDPSKSWSELPIDLLNSVYDRLGFADLQRAKSVCSSWHSPLRQSVSKSQIPWLVLLPNQYNKKHLCWLYNPEEDRIYKTDLGVQFSMCVCIATYGSWLLMRYPLYSLYLVNPFTKERINLPPVESQLGTIKTERTFNDSFIMSDGHNKWESKYITIGSPVFWMDDLTKDYVVLWRLDELCVVYAKKGDNMWKQIPDTADCSDILYMDHKLYFSSSSRKVFKIIDLSGEIPQETFTVNRFELLRLHNEIDSWSVLETKLVVTATGDVLKVEKMVGMDVNGFEIFSFRVYKVYSTGVYKKDERVDSLGDEAMLYDLGITMLANDLAGFQRNSIYFVLSSLEEKTTGICLFSLETQKMEPLFEFDCKTDEQLERARWTIPNFNRKCF